MASQTHQSPRQQARAGESLSSPLPPSLTLSFNTSSPPSSYGSSRPPSPGESIFSATSSRDGSMLSSNASEAAPPAADLAALAEDHYFRANPAPKDLASHVSLARDFISSHHAVRRRVVLITSGGTTVPLEKQTVRFIDNFSAGTRGATSAEYFLEAGYAVIFLHRQFSLQPYSRHYTHATNCFLDFLTEGENGSVVARPEYAEKMVNVLRKYNESRERNTLLMLPFVTITDYLHELRAIAQLMRPLGPDGLLYLAAAVSDFFVPLERMAEHKIQSTDAADAVKRGEASNAGSEKGTPLLGPQTPAPGTSASRGASEEEETFDNFDSSPTVPRSKRLVVDLDPVPKFLKNLVDGWAPEGMIVSFKLETDPEILVHKAKYALERYQHHLVIGNLLATRKWEVVFVSGGPDRWIRVPTRRRKKTISGLESLVGAADRDAAARLEADEQNNKPLDPTELPTTEPEIEIESLIVPAVRDAHTAHIKAAEKAAI